MWLVSCRRQGMLTQGPAPDPKCKLIISSFLTLPHLLDCLNFTRNAMSIVLSLQILGGWNRWGWLIYIRVWVGGSGWVPSYSFFSCAFVFVFSHSESLYLDDWSMMAVVCFFVFSLFSLSLVPLTRSY